MLLRRGSGGGRPAIAAAMLVMLCVIGCIAATPAPGGGECPKYKDSKQPLNKRIDDLLRRMTLAEKIGQMSQIERENATFDVMRNYFIGSVLSGGGSVPSAQASPAAWVAMVNEMQRGAMSTRLGIPMMYGIDAVHGHGNVYKATIFPHNVGIGCTRDPDLAKRIGAAVAAEVRATGIPYVFAPCVAVCRDPRWGRCYESFTCSKHYVGDGGTTRGMNENNTVATLRELMTIHMPPYYSAVVQGVSTVMVSFSSWNGVKMHANHFLITDFLKSKLRFRGFVISDWQGLDRITTPAHADYMLSIKLGIMAGIDMVMIPFTYTEFIDDLTTLVQNGTIPMSRIDDAVRRILRVKFTMGLFENPYSDLSLVGELGKQEHRDLAREAVRKSLVLLKNGKPNDSPLLPLPKNPKSILVAGSHADDLGNQCGGWTITWQGLSGNNLTAGGTTILDGIKKSVDPNTEVVFEKNPDDDFMAKNHGKFDFAIVVVGEAPYAETFGDNLNLTIPSPGPEVIRSVCGGGGVRCVVVIVSGRPLVVEPFVDEVDALVAAWLPGSEGEGVSDVLFGDYGFCGKLGRTWFRRVEQLPMNVGDEDYDPLFPFGFGLETQPAYKG
uniref:Beta-glucosidase n=1 Tax=Leersia perrieri TaxID=77586 RepID=A0A0D9VBT4_9ORYZ